MGGLGLPNINITFAQQAQSTVEDTLQGTVAIIVKDATASDTGSFELTTEEDIPATLSEVNQAYIKRAFVGYVNKPRKVLLYVLDDEAANLQTALAYLERVEFDYLVGPVDCDSTEAAEIETWIKARWADGFYPRAVLPNKASDFEGIVNFATDDIVVEDETLDTAAYCSRIAGLICGTPLDISCTCAPLTEVTDVARLSKSEMDTAINAGKFIIYHDGQKVKVGRGVTSLITTTETTGDAYKKIKVVDTICAIKTTLQRTIQDEYIGKYPNTYDNKCVLITAINNYFVSLEQDNVLQSGTSSVAIDLDAQTKYLKSNGYDVENMSEDEIKMANTGSKVFLMASIRILDAIEDIDLYITI